MRHWVTVGSSIYVVLLDGATFEPTVQKSTDGGQTFAEQDAANRPTNVSVNNNQADVSVTLDGSTLYVAYARSTDDLTIKLFDTSTDTWQANVAVGGPTVVQAGQTQSYWEVFKRAGDNYIIYYTPGDNTVVNKTLYARLNSGVWTNDIVVPTAPTNENKPTCAVAGTSGRIHLFYLTQGAPGDFFSLRQRTLDSSDVLHTEQLIGNAQDIWDLSATGFPSLFGSTIYLIYSRILTYFPLQYSEVQHVYIASAESANDPDWTLEQVAYLNPPAYTAGSPDSDAPAMGAVALLGTDLYAFWSSPPIVPPSDTRGCFALYSSFRRGGVWRNIPAIFHSVQRVLQDFAVNFPAMASYPEARVVGSDIGVLFYRPSHNDFNTNCAFFQLLADAPTFAS